MEINIDKRGSSEFYDEVLSIQSNYKKIIKNPRKKIKPLSSNAKLLTGISIVILIIFAALKIIDPTYPYYIYVVIIFAVATVLGLVYYMMIKKSISKVKDSASSRKFIIGNDFVELQAGNEKSRIEYSNLQYVLINKYSICFIPREPTVKIIAIGIENKNLIVNFEGYESLLVDNSSLYQ